MTALLACLLLLSCRGGATGRTHAEAVGGVLDLRAWDFDRDGPAGLTGEWKFRWGELRAPGQLQAEERVKTCIRVPGIWNGRVENGRTLAGDGCATYRLRVLLPRSRGGAGGSRLAVMVPDLGTAYALYLDGVPAGGGGVVGESARAARPGYRPDVFECAPPGDTLDVVLLISNFHHRKGGAWETIVLGTAPAMRDLRELRLVRDFFLFGSISIIGIYHLVLFALRRRERAYLYFGVFCLLIAVRIMTTGEYYCVRLFPRIGWEMVIGAEYLSFYAAMPLFFYFMGSLFPAVFPARILRAAAAAGTVFCFIVLVFPSRVYTHTMQTYQALSTAMGLYGLGALLVAMKRGRAGTVPFTAGFVILFVTVINDFLMSNLMAGTGYLVPFGLFVFIFSQAYLLSRRFSRAYDSIENLSSKLLQKRMDPHFLFNALNTVHALIMKDPGRADRAVIMLADNYRYLIDRSFLTVVPFEDEWRFVENYLDLEELRFRDSLTVSMERKGDFSGMRIPPLTIQPLVENALKHGVQKNGGQGHVSVFAEATADRLTLTVTDNGAGLDSNDLYSRSLGNIRKRLHHYFGKAHMALDSAPGGGVTVTVAVPRDRVAARMGHTEDRHGS
jgi:hypothetical protein